MTARSDLVARIAESVEAPEILNHGVERLVAAGNDESADRNADD